MYTPGTLTHPCALAGRCAAGVLIALLCALPVAATTPCRDQATTDLERAYCEIAASGKGGTLPTFHDFRKNSEKMQRLLLKVPARRAGIELPAAAEPAPEITPTPAPTAAPTNTVSAGMDRCVLQKNQIQCGYDYYLLQTNLQNHELAADALTEANQLLLPDRDSTQYASASDLAYLSACYPPYIEKMLVIGLGDSTMSFTRFAATYTEIVKMGGGFSQRFQEMYELLKKEKAHNAVQRRYKNNFPDSIEQCQFLSGNLIVCDDVVQNWVYQR